MTYWIPKTGYIAAFKLGGIPTYIHWSFPVYGLVIVAFLGRWSVSAVAASSLAYLLLVLVHEAGHALFARYSRATVHAMVVTGAGGVCIADKPTRLYRQLLFYAGGLIGQFVLLIISVVYLALFGYPEHYAIKCIFIVLTLFNALLFIGNIIPWRDNDGAKIMLTIKEMCSTS